MLCDPQPTNSLPVSFGAGMCTGTLFSLLGSSLEGAALEDEPFDERSNLKLDPASPRSARRASPFSAFRLRVVSRSKLEISLLFGSISSAFSRIWIASSHLRRFDSAAPFRKYPFAQSGFSSMAFSASLIAFVSFSRWMNAAARLLSVVGQRQSPRPRNRIGAPATAAQQARARARAPVQHPVVGVGLDGLVVGGDGLDVVRRRKVHVAILLVLLGLADDHLGLGSRSRLRRHVLRVRPV